VIAGAPPNLARAPPRLRVRARAARGRDRDRVSTPPSFPPVAPGHTPAVTSSTGDPYGRFLILLLALGMPMT